MKEFFKDVVAQRLSAAPGSVAKSELVEELAENLFCRYMDLTESGVELEEAKSRAVDALGDTDELVEYLKEVEPDQPLPGPMDDTRKPEVGQIEDILHNVEDILRGAFHKAKSTFKEVKETVKGEPEEDGSEEKGWKVTYQSSGRHVEINSDDLKASMKDMMEDIEQVIRDAVGVAKDACKTAKEAAEKVCSEASDSCEVVDVEAEPVDPTALSAIDVQTYGGDIIVRMSQPAEGDVLVGGDVEELEVFRSADGVLTIRPVRTETSAFFFGRGIFHGGSSADVVLDLPCRSWDNLKLATTGGDVQVEGTCPVNSATVTSVSGDIRGTLPTCGKVVCRTTNGDIRWTGDVSDFRMESISGDVTFRGQTDHLEAKTTSGDLTMEGSICAAAVKTVSGDVCLRTNVLPGRMDMGTTSGDMWVDIPDAGPFTARFRSTSGDFTSDFFTGRMGGRNCVFNYRGGGESHYSFASISGDVEIRKYR